MQIYSISMKLVLFFLVAIAMRSSFAFRKWYSPQLRPTFLRTTPNSKAEIGVSSVTATAATMFGISAPLGVLLDNYHGLFNVLNYNEKSIPIIVTIEFLGNKFVVLKTAFFVAPLFGVAGATMSVILWYLDKKYFTVEEKLTPSWPKVFYGISFFSFQYYLSGLLDSLSVSVMTIHGILISLAMFGYAIFDYSFAGFFLALLTSVVGPITEIVLVHLGLYSYTNADFFGVCSWIPWVYFLGGQAVGNLSRKIVSLNGTK